MRSLLQAAVDASNRKVTSEISHLRQSSPRLVGRRFGVNVHQNDLCFPVEFVDYAVRRGERAVDGPHEGPAEKGDDGDRNGSRQYHDVRLARGGRGKVGRLDDRFILVPQFVGDVVFTYSFTESNGSTTLSSNPGMGNPATVVIRYVDNAGAATEAYPLNPNGSAGGINGYTTADGRFSIVMPHPERAFRTVQHSWAPAAWSRDGNDSGPWMRMFRNARVWLG